MEARALDLHSTDVAVPLRTIGVLGMGWAVVASAAAGGLVSLSLIDQVVLLGVAVVLPLAIGGHASLWAAATVATVVSLLLPVGWSGLLIVPLGLAAGAGLVTRLRLGGLVEAWGLGHVAGLLAPAYALVAAGELMASRTGLELFGIGEPIVELTAVHYVYAGSAALVLARVALRTAPRRWQPVGRAAVVLTAVAPPVVAVGFVTEAAAAQVGGAVVMTLGVWLTAGLQLQSAVVPGRPIRARVLLGISGMAVWVPMVLAVGWAAGQHWDVPALSIPDMARTHGLPNALAFTLCGLLARRCTVAASGRRTRVAPA